MLGTRLHFSFRTVIIPHKDRYNELYIPWAVAVNLLKEHIIGRLMNAYDLSFGDAIARQILALMRYDPLIDQIMSDLIKESKYPGLGVLWNRNPQKGSVSIV
jgi:hypothetical protein